MSNRAGGNARAAKYDYLIKLLLIGDSGTKLLLCILEKNDLITNSLLI
jgi:hypothetical protein